MRFFQGIVVAAASAFLIACGGGSPMDKMMGHMEKVVSIIEGNKGDLDKAAKEVQAYADSNKAALEAVAKDMAKWGEEMEAKTKDDPAAMEKFMKEMESKGAGLKARSEALEKDVPGFKEHEGLQKALASLGMN